MSTSTTTPKKQPGEIPDIPPPTPEQAFAQLAKKLVEDQRRKVLEELLKRRPKMATSSATAEEQLFLDGNTQRSTARTDDKLVSETISCAKEDRESLKRSDKKSYDKLKENSCKALESTTFEMAKPFDTRTEIKQLEDVTSVVTKVNKLKDRLRRDDMIDVFKIPSEFVKNSSGDWVPKSGATAIDVLKDYKKLDIETVKKSTA